MKYVFKCATPQQDLAGNVYALENGKDLLFKEDFFFLKKKKLRRQSLSKQHKTAENANTSQPSRREF